MNESESVWSWESCREGASEVGWGGWNQVGACVAGDEQGNRTAQIHPWMAGGVLRGSFWLDPPKAQSRRRQGNAEGGEERRGVGGERGCGVRRGAGGDMHMASKAGQPPHDERAHTHLLTVSTALPLARMQQQRSGLLSP